MSSYETTKEIVGTLRAAGYEISTLQLSEWSRRGLIPQPQRPGLGRGKGTETRFPPGTSQQVLVLATIRQSTGRDLDHAGWVLWTYGFKVADEIWKRPFIEVSKEFFREIRNAIDRELQKTDNEIAISDTASIDLEAISKGRNKSEFFGPVRRSLGRDDFTALLHIVLEVALGIFDPSARSKSYDPNSAKELLDIFRKTIEDSGSQNSSDMNKFLSELSVSATALKEMLTELSSEFSKFRETQLMDAFNDDELLIGRNETTFFSVAFREVARTMNPRPRALDLLQRLLGNLTAKQHALMIFFWLIARRLPTVAAGLLNNTQAANSQRGAQ